jgi:hypothetical protein
MDAKKTKRREELRLKLNAKLDKDRTLRGGKRRYELKSLDEDKKTSKTTTEDTKTSENISSAITSFESILKKEGKPGLNDEEKNKMAAALKIHEKEGPEAAFKYLGISDPEKALNDLYSKLEKEKLLNTKKIETPILEEIPKPKEMPILKETEIRETDKTTVKKRELKFVRT